MSTIFVLSGGGSRGAAQVGMLRALTEAGIAPDLVVGASVGAINGCAFAADPSPDGLTALEEHWLSMTSRRLVGGPTEAARNLVARRPYVYSADRLAALLTDWIGVRTLEDMTVPTRVAATSLSTGLPVWFEHGDVIERVCASAALPGVFPPVRLPGRDDLLVDAGVAENTPWTAALEAASPGDTIYVLEASRRSSSVAPRNPLTVLIAALTAAVHGRPDPTPPQGIRTVSLRISDTFDCGNVFDFSHSRTLIRLGLQAGRDALLPDHSRHGSVPGGLPHTTRP